MIHIQGICKRYGSKVLFEEASAHLGHRSRVALIGPNGAGKSTLIRILLRQETSDTGNVTQVSNLSIGYLAQEVPKFGGRTVLAEVMRLDGRREELLSTQKELETRLSVQPDDLPSLERYGRILEELELMDEYRLESRAKQILNGIGFSASEIEKDLTEFSGGWLMRVALARILLMDPDLLLLDEPTNHLDLESLLWLEEFLKNFRGAILSVSHDLAFLNRLVNEVWELDQQQLVSYRGNLDSYFLQKQERLRVLESQYRGQQAKVAEIERFVARFGAKATKAKQAQSRLKQLEKMDLIELPDANSSIHFRFPPVRQSGREVITLKGASQSYGSFTVFRDLNWVIQRGSRVAIVGVNGAGKTTLLKLLSGKIEATGGEVRFGHEVKVGYYAQLQAESLNLNRTILQELEEVAPEMPVSQVRGIAGAFMFSGDLIEKKCGVLSGGEKARVALAKLLLSPSNFLILDEPTNHLDVESRGVLLEALQDYPGTLCLVSHDREFISPLVDSVLEIIPDRIEGKGSQVVQLLGSYDDYLQRKIKEASSNSQDSTQGGKKSQAQSLIQSVTRDESKGPSNNQKKSWQREKETAESEIEKLEIRQSELQLLLGNVETYQDQVLSMKLAEEQRQITKNLAQKYQRWEELSGLLGD